MTRDQNTAHEDPSRPEQASELKTLHDFIASSCARKTSGSIILMAKEEAGGRIVSATVLINEGKTVEMRFPGRSSGDALTYFFEHEITRVTYVEQFGDRSLPTLANALDIHKVLQDIEKRLGQGEKPGPQLGGGLYERVKELLTDLYGDNAADKIRKIAAKHPPKDHPRDFLGNCMKLVEINYGKKVAQESFEKFYRELT